MVCWNCKHLDKQENTHNVPIYRKIDMGIRASKVTS
jgi:hypothetical protein